MGAWRRLEDPESNAAWDRFEDKFLFKPGTRPRDWPGIHEPADSVTFSIGHVYDLDSQAYDRSTLDLAVKLAGAFRRCVNPGTPIYVLDWQHSCYSFEPHGEFSYTSEDDWPVPPLPNGDYHIFLGQKMEFGVFGHPWEQTMCVFGLNLIEAFASDPPELFNTKVRVAGRAV